MLRGILTVGGWTMASRLLGFLRDILIAALLGAGPIADAFLVAIRLPNLFRRLFGEGAFNAAFVPQFTALVAIEGHAAAHRFAQDAFAVMAFGLVGLSALAMAAMPFVMLGFAPGFLDVPGKLELTVELARIAFPYMPMICLGALVAGMLNGLDRYATAAATGMFYNLCMIAALLWAAKLLATPGHVLAWAVSASGVLQLGVLLWAVRRAGMPLVLRRPRLTADVRTMLRRMGPGVFGAGATQVSMAIDVVVASLLAPGTAAILYYADRLMQLPLGVIGVAVGTALLPTLTRALRDGRGTAQATLNRAVEYALVLTLPAALALAAASGPIVVVLFQRGAFTPADAALTAQALAVYAAGLPAFVLIKVLSPAFFARGDTARPMQIGLACVGLNIALNIALMQPLAHLGPPMAAGLSAWANVAALGLVLHRRGHAAADAALWRSVARMLLAGLLMAGVLLALERFAYAPLAGAGALRWVGLALMLGGGLLAYGVAGELLGAFRLRDLAARLRRRRQG